jgi:hypothetical protein
MSFAKGHARQGGRVKGTPNKATERQRRLIEAVDANDKAIIESLIRDAKAGDASARTIYFRFLRPPQPRGTLVEPIDYSAPKTTEEARAVILTLGERLAKGEIGVEVHDSLIAGLRAYLGDKAAEQQRELDRLKEDLGVDTGSGP